MFARSTSLTPRHTVLGACVLAYFGSRVGQLAIAPLVTPIVDAFQVTPGTVGVALTGMWATYALMQLPSGLLADRHGERAVILVALTAATLGAVGLALAPTVWVFAGVCLLLGAGVGLYYNAGTALLAREFDAVGSAIGVHRAGSQLAGVVSPVAAVAVAARFGWRTGLLVGAAAAVPALLVTAVAVRRTPPLDPGGTVRDRVRIRRLADVVTRPGIARPTALAVLGEFVIVATLSFLPAFLIATRGLSVTTAGVLFSGYFAVVTLYQPIAGWLADRIDPERSAAITAVAGVVGYGSLAAGTGLESAVVGVVLAGVAMSWVTPVQAGIVERLDPGERGVGFGTVRTVYVLLGASGSAVTGLVADLAGWRASFGLLAGCLAVGFIVLVSGRR